MIYSMGRPAKAPQPAYGRHLAELRKRAGLTQQQLADVLEVRQATVASWERSANPPRGQSIPPLAEALGVSVDQLLKVNGQSKRSRLDKLVAEVAQLPRRRQQRVISLVETLLEQETNDLSSTS
jgi:transcriptional regulator with XRE-family HTH domain